MGKIEMNVGWLNTWARDGAAPSVDPIGPVDLISANLGVAAVLAALLIAAMVFGQSFAETWVVEKVDLDAPDVPDAEKKKVNRQEWKVVGAYLAYLIITLSLTGAVLVSLVPFALLVGTWPQNALAAVGVVGFIVAHVWWVFARAYRFVSPKREVFAYKGILATVIFGAIIVGAFILAVCNHNAAN